MRTVLLMIAISLGDISASILKVHGMWNGNNDVVVNFFAATLIVSMVMDITDFLKGQE